MKKCLFLILLIPTSLFAFSYENCLAEAKDLNANPQKMSDEVLIFLEQSCEKTPVTYVQLFKFTPEIEEQMNSKPGMESKMKFFAKMAMQPFFCQRIGNKREGRIRFILMKDNRVWDNTLIDYKNCR